LEGGDVEGVSILEAVGNYVTIGSVVEPREFTARVFSVVEVGEEEDALFQLEKRDK